MLGRADPLWAVLSDERYHGNLWDTEEFFGLGQAEIDDVIERISKLGIRLRYDAALDFGCGVGRLTRALGKYFNAVAGVDIAPAMIELANRFNTQPQKCRYFLNTDDTLRAFETDAFDFAYTRLVLQHMRPELSRGYIAEFFRVLRPGGIAAFQIPGQYRRAESALAPPDPSRLPDAAFNAFITVSRPVIVARPASSVTLQVGVQNFSSYVWPGPQSENPLRVGVRWFDQFAALIGSSEGGAPIPRETPPGDKVHLSIAVRVPQQPGFYLMQIDIVQSGVSSGREHGSPTPHVSVAVFEGADPERAAEVLPFNAQMEYHGIPRPEIEALVAHVGGEMLAVFDDPASNPEWPGHLYVARKR